MSAIERLSIGWRSHLVAERFGAELHECDDCIVLRTPGNPTYYWGNCLIVSRAPGDAELEHWLDRFDTEIANAQPASKHVAIGIDTPRPTETLPRWQAAGFDLEETAVLALQPGGLRSIPSAKAEAVAVRKLRLSEEAPLAVALQCACNEDGYEPEGYRLFCERSTARIAAMEAQGIGAWFGAFTGDTLAADCGLLNDGTLGRFRNVETHPQWRRQGLARALVHGVCRHAFDVLGVRLLVMCADPHDVAIGIYRSLGFAQIETHWQLQRRAPEDR